MKGAVAAVTFPAPHGTEVVVLAPNQSVTFGRSSNCDIRFAHAPIADDGVPRVAGRLIATAGRVIVESLPGDGRRSLEINADGQPSRLLVVGEAYSPATQEFRITVYGDQQGWPLLVAVRGEDTELAPGDDEHPTRHIEVVFTPMQEKVLRAYVEPVRRGRLEPATHREVADQLGYHVNSVREALYEAWARLFAANVPMPDVSDKRVAVVEALRLHGMLLTAAEDT